MALIEKEKAELLEISKTKGKMDELMAKYWALKDELEKALDAKYQAYKINVELENELSKARKEISRLNAELEEKDKLYKKTLDENIELEQWKELLLRFVYYFSKEALGL